MNDSKEDLLRKIESLKEQLGRLDSKRAVLISLLEKLENGYAHAAQTDTGINRNSNRQHLSLMDDNIRLFFSLFQGRPDVFAKRWENRQGRNGYAPACKNEWVKDT